MFIDPFNQKLIINQACQLAFVISVIRREKLNRYTYIILLFGYHKFHASLYIYDYDTPRANR